MLQGILSPYKHILGLGSAKHPIIALETGCSYAWVPENMDYLSTPNIVSSLISPTGGKLYSLDNDAEKIRQCEMHMSHRNQAQHVKFMHGESVRSIADLPLGTGIDFVWFDSEEDSDHALAEFMAIQRFLSPKHVICVDDFGSRTSKKWQAISQALYAKGYFIQTFNTPTGLLIGHNL